MLKSKRKSIGGVDEQRLYLFVEHSPTALAMFDRDMRYLAASQRWIEEYRLAGQVIIGRSHYQVFPDIPARWKEIHRRALAGEVLRANEDRFDRGDGSVQWLRWEVRPWYRADADIGGIVIATEDITERTWSDALVRGQNRILEMVARAAPLRETLDALLRFIEELSPGMLSSILLLDADRTHVRHGAAPSLPEDYMRAIDGQPIGPHAGSCGTAAFRREQVVVEDIATDPLWEHYRDTALKFGLRACWSTPIFDAQRRVMGTFAVYYRRPSLPDARHLRIIETATATAAIAMMRRRAETALRAGEERLRLALDAAHTGTFDWDIAEERIVWSRWHEELWGYAPGEFDGTYAAFASRVHAEDLPAINAEVQRCMVERKPFEREFRVVWPDGSVHWIHTRGEFQFDTNGRALRMRGAVSEITDRKRSEQQQRELAHMSEYSDALTHAKERAEAADRVKSAFLATMSHELRTPLNSIIGFTGVLLQELAGPLNNEQRKQLSMVRASGQHLLALINDVLDISKIEAGELRIYPAAMDVRATIERVVASMTPQAQGKGLAIELRLGALGSIVSDARRVEQILLNLLSNAIKFTAQGGVTLSAERTAEHVEFAIADSGIGIDPQHLSLLFQPFRQIDSTLSRNHEGTGLGLAISHRLATLLGGAIRVHSEAGRGSTFIVTLPLVVPATP